MLSFCYCLQNSYKETIGGICYFKAFHCKLAKNNKWYQSIFKWGLPSFKQNNLGQTTYKIDQTFWKTEHFQPGDMERRETSLICSY